MEAAIEAAVRKVVREELSLFRTSLLAELRGGAPQQPMSTMLLLTPPDAGGAKLGSAVKPATTLGSNSRSRRSGAGGENGGTPGSGRRGWTAEMEEELYTLLQQQTKGVPGVSEDRIAWQVIRAVSDTMSHLSKDAIRKKGKRMLQRMNKAQAEEGPEGKRSKPSSSVALEVVQPGDSQPADGQAGPSTSARQGSDENDGEEDRSPLEGSKTTKDTEKEKEEPKESGKARAEGSP